MSARRTLTILLAIACLHPHAARAQTDSERDARIASLSLRQKLGQLFIVGHPGRTVNGDTVTFVRDHAVGGFFLQPVTHYLFPEDLAALTFALQTEAAASPTGIPLFLAADNEGGVATILHPELGGAATPGNLALGASGREDDAYAAYNALGVDMFSCGLNLNLAPAIDVLGSTANPDYTVRSFGSQTPVNARLGAAAVRGLQDAGIIATAKHFPALAFFDEDTHVSAPHLSFSTARLDAPDLLAHVRAAIDAGTGAIMTCHVYVDAWDRVFPVTMSQKILTGILREKLGYDGLIMTDSLGMGAINADYEVETITVRAVAAGCDILLLVSSAEKDFTRRLDALEEAVKTGQLEEARIDDAVRRILRAKTRWNVGQRDDPRGEDPLRTLPGSAERRAKNEAAARNGVVIVRDKDGLLPLNAQDDDLLVVCPPSFVTRAGKGRAVIPLGYPLGHFIRQAIPAAREVRVDTVPTQAQTEFVLSKVADADRVVVGVLLAEQSPPQQDLVRAILATGKPVILVGLGLPSDLALFPEAGTFVAAHGPAAINCRAAVDMLLGEHGGGGTLPIPVGTLYPAGHRLHQP